MSLNRSQAVLCQGFRKLPFCFEKIIELAELTHDDQKARFYDELLSRVGEEIFEQLNTKIQKEQIQPPTSFPLVDLEIKT